MRSYRRNSPQAAARIVALTLLADGHLSRSELDMLDQRQAARILGLTPDGLHQVLQDLCEDLLAGAQQNWGDACKVDPDTLAALLADVDDEALRRTVMGLCVDVANADRHVAEGESIVLSAVLDQWGGATEARYRTVPAPSRPRPAATPICQ